MGSLASPATLRASRPRPSDTNGQSSGVRRVVTLIHLAAWAELGVLTRAFLDKLFSLGCGGAWGPCLAGGFYFNGLPANLAGSFVIGLFAASSVLGLNNGRPLALLPAAHPWQANISVQIGERRLPDWPTCPTCLLPAATCWRQPPAASDAGHLTLAAPPAAPNPPCPPARQVCAPATAAA